MLAQAFREARTSLGESLTALVATDGSMRQIGPLLSGDALRAYRPGDLADLVHYVGMLHANPLKVANAIPQSEQPPGLARWLRAAEDGFDSERTLLLRLVIAAGPVPSTPGQAATDAAVLGQRQALDMLGQSDRAGCALGMAMALVLDWQIIGTLLDQIAARLGRAVPPKFLPDTSATIAMAEAAASTAAIERAMLFGAQQLLAQHRGLWSLLDARRSARTA